jgi:hypothetical protein
LSEKENEDILANKISNKDLHDITKTKDMEILLIQKRWRWLGHVLRGCCLSDVASSDESDLYISFISTLCYTAS